MPNIDQDLVKSGFDVEALLGANYLRMLIQTALDAGEIPREFPLGTDVIRIHSAPGNNRLYDPTTFPEGSEVPASIDAFQTEILFNRPDGANLRVRLKAETDSTLAVPLDLLIKITFDPAHMIDGEAKAAIVIEGVDVEIDPNALTIIFNKTGKTKADILLLLQEKLNRPIDLGSSSKFKQVERIEIAWLEPDADHDAALGIYINILLRDGDEIDQFVDPRGDLAEAVNFLPTGEDIAFASRPGLYRDLSKDVFSRTALKKPGGGFEHALRYNILNPNSTRIGDVHSIAVTQAFSLNASTPSSPIVTPFNGLRIQMNAEYNDPIEATNTDVTFTITIKPIIKSDGTLTWDTDLDVDVDALFEFITLWGTMLTFILFGPIGAGIFLGATLIGQIGAGIYFGEHFESRASKKADATLSDVIPDRLSIKTRRWDPFYATKHQVVIKPSQAEFNAVGFMMVGKAFVGRELVPPIDTVIRDEFRDGEDRMAALRYLIADAATVVEDRKIKAYGRHEREFEPAEADEPNLFSLTFDQYAARASDPEGPLVLQNIAYFPAYVHLENNQIRHLLCISSTELEEIRDELRSAESDQVFAQLQADEGPEITQQVIDDLSANGGTPTQEEIDAEVDLRLRKRLKEEMDDFEPPTPLEMAQSGVLKGRIRWDLTPEEMFNLSKQGIIAVDSALKFIHGPNGKIYLRDQRGSGFEPGDNLKQRPRYKPGPNGPEFID